MFTLFFFSQDILCSWVGTLQFWFWYKFFFNVILSLPLIWRRSMSSSWSFSNNSNSFLIWTCINDPDSFASHGSRIQIYFSSMDPWSGSIFHPWIEDQDLFSSMDPGSESIFHPWIEDQDLYLSMDSGSGSAWKWNWSFLLTT